MSDKRLRVILAEDSYLVREGTRKLLEASGELEIIAAVGSATELVDAVARMNPDAVVTDIRMPPDGHMAGIQAAHRIRATSPHVGVVVLSQYADPAYAMELLRDGAAGVAYLLKDRIGDFEELVRALREVVAGRSVLDPLVVEGLLARRAKTASSPLTRLTSRELEVLRAMAEGRTNAGIAQTLIMSESAVEKHVNSIFAKLGLAPEGQVHRRVSAVVTFLRATEDN